MTMRIQIPHAVTLMQQHQPTSDMAKLQLTQLAFFVTTTQEPSIIMTRQDDIELFIILSVPRDTMCHGFASFHERGHVQSLELLVYIVKDLKKRAGPSVALLKDSPSARRFIRCFFVSKRCFSSDSLFFDDTRKNGSCCAVKQYEHNPHRFIEFFVMMMKYSEM